VARARTILLELERVWNTLNDIGAVCAGVGLAAGNNRFLALTDEARGRMHAYWARFLFGSIVVGGDIGLDAHATAAARRAPRIRRGSSRVAQLLQRVVHDRMPTSAS
jgi:Ni,Fe-hydrogenase III large subunit